MAMPRWIVPSVLLVASLAGCAGGGGDDGGGGPTTRTLSVTVAGAGTGTVTSSPPGISCSAGTCSAQFAPDASVVLTAAPGGSSTFGGWSGGGCGGGGPCTVLMGGDLSVTATFDAVPPVLHTLQVIVAGGGSGSVASAPPGIDCPAGSCTADFTEGATVTLSAAPALDGSTFAGWSGACAGELSTICNVTLDTDLSATATFDPPPTLRRLSVTVTGPGSGSVTSVPAGINCSSGTCSADFVEGTDVTLTATPAAGGGHVFAGWSGGCAAAGTSPCTLTLDVDRSATATFSTMQTLSVTVVGDGTGTVTSVPSGISCTTGSSAGCSATFPTGTTVTLTGAAAGGSSFYGWAPTCDASPDPCTFDIQSTASLTATFTAWTVVRPFPTDVRGVAAMGATLVAVGAGAAPTSTDGLAWTGHPLPASTRLRGVASDGTGSTAVAVGEGGAVFSTSAAGSGAWTARTAVTTSALNAVAHGGGTFVAVGSAGAIVTSGDGATWTARSSNTPYDLLAVAWGGGTFVAVGFGGTVLTSADGVDWVSRASGTTQPLSGVAFDAAWGFVAVGRSGAVATSANGSAWTPGTSLPVRAAFPTAEVRGIAASGGRFVALDSNHDVHRSDDGGAAWTTAQEAEDLKGSSVTGIAAAAGAFYALSDGGISRAPDGAAWTRVLALGPNVYGMAYGASTYVLVGHGAIFSSPDGLTWTSRYAGNSYLRATDMVSSVVFANGRFVAVSGHGILGSTDGVDWTVVAPAPAPYGGQVAYGGAAGFVVTSASGSAADVWTSPDGDTWTPQAGTGIASPIHGLAFGGGSFVAAGGSTSGKIHTAATPATTAAWIEQSLPSPDHTLGSLVSGGGRFVASDVQTGQDALVSTNGVNWTWNHAPEWMGKVVAYGNGLFLSQTLLTSADGVAWSRMTWRPPGMTYAYAGIQASPTGWVLADGRAFAFHP